jgi:hypothetical protein
MNDLTITTSHSEFFQLLEQRGHRLNFSRTDDSNLALSRFGEYIYENLIIFAPSAEDFGGTVDVSVILEFVDSGRNLLLAASPSASEAMREIALECGIKMDETNAYVQVRETAYISLFRTHQKKKLNWISAHAEFHIIPTRACMVNAESVSLVHSILNHRRTTSIMMRRTRAATLSSHRTISSIRT